MVQSCLNESNDGKRLEMWLSTVLYYLGDHSSWIHPEDEDHQIQWQSVEHEPLINILNGLIDQFSKDFSNTSVQHSSQCVESVNATYAHVAPKKTYWDKIDAIIASGVIRQKSPIGEPFIIREWIHFNE